ASRSSSSAWLRVSATKTPPYGPKCPRGSGRSYICISDLGDESGNSGRILDALGGFDAAGYVYRPGTHAPDRLSYIVPREATGQHQRPDALLGDQRPVEALPDAAILLDMAVEQPPRRSGK